jgi:NTE family protein
MMLLVVVRSRTVAPSNISGSSMRCGISYYVMPMNDTKKTVCLALQGGGAHAAFTWGVLDRLLDEVALDRLQIAAISGASGGALNGAALAQGLNANPEAAKRLLTRLWDTVAAKSLWLPALNHIFAGKRTASHWNVDSNPLVIALDMVQQVNSPYFTPWLHNPIGPIMEEIIPDFAALNSTKSRGPKIYVSATNVNRTALRIFGPGDINAKVLMASTCYPTLFEAVEIDGEFYWDGGYMANPALRPLLDWGDDLLTILIDPLDIEDGPPKMPRQIVNRINEVSFGASWVTEMRQIALINDLIARGVLRGGNYTQKRFHVIRNDKWMEEIGAASKNTPSREFFYVLREVGRQAGHEWIQRHFADLGVKSSFDVDSEVKGRLNGH